MVLLTTERLAWHCGDHTTLRSWNRPHDDNMILIINSIAPVSCTVSFVLNFGRRPLKFHSSARCVLVPYLEALELALATTLLSAQHSGIASDYSGPLQACHGPSPSDYTQLLLECGTPTAGVLTKPAVTVRYACTVNKARV